MADSKLTALTALTTPAGADLLYIVDDVAGTATGKKISLTDFFGNVPVTITLGSGADFQVDNGQGYMGAGIYTGMGSKPGSNGLSLFSGGTERARVNNGGLNIGPNSLGFGAAVSGSDVGVKRSGAGIAQITDGSTGAGQLIFIVPTSDPGISGALWNNGGSLAISA